jgi:4-hydroxybenzoate polyprenyltransferase
MNRTFRLLHYVAVMFPPGSHLPQALALFAAIYCSLQVLSGIGPLSFGWRTAVGAGTVVIALLLVRLYDDVRDAPADAVLGRAGDPRYIARPTVTGLVSVPEVRGLVAALSIAVVTLNLVWGGPRTRIVTLAGFAITWLAFRWFFVPSLSGKAPPLATLARKSLTILVSGYVVAVFADERNVAQLSAWAWLLLLAPCFEAAAWEVSRKIRAPSDETDYGTYSKVLGPRRSAALTICFVALSLLCLLPIARLAGVGWAYPAALVGAALIVIVASARFMRRPTRDRANLRPYTELFGAVANGGLAVALFVRHGLVIR